MVLGSDIPLERDILRRELPYTLSWVEWSADNRELSIESSFIQTGNTSKDFFTVPDNKTLYIVSAWLQIEVAPGGAGLQGFARFDINGNRFLQLQGVSTATTVERMSDSVSVNPSMPIKINSGGVLTLSTNQTFLKGTCGFVGFLVPKRLN